MTATDFSNPYNSGASLPQLNFIRMIIVLAIGFGYASTLPRGPETYEFGLLLGLAPSWIGVQLLFFLSGALAMRSIDRGVSAKEFLLSRALRNGPLVALVTLFVCAGLYPALGDWSAGAGPTLAKLGRYFLETVSAFDPGQPVPGLLDGSPYPALVQGAIWTLRWGALLYLGTAILKALGVFNIDRAGQWPVQWIAILSLVGFAFIANSGRDIAALLYTPFHFGYVYFLGMALGRTDFQRKYRPGLLKVWMVICLFIAIGFYAFDIAIVMREILLTVILGVMCLMFLRGAVRTDGLIAQCPNLALPLYVTLWPTAQLILYAVPGISSWALICTALPVSLLVSLGLHAVINQQVYAWAARITRREYPAPDRRP